ncbi:MAG TPA: hypothetical protein VEY90_08235 [Thermoleophilaceae bacterium]|nr:hypothetical protein [Thermoleophilaceae bacterium]
MSTRALSFTVAAILLVLAVAPQADAYVLVSAGKTGRSSSASGTCKYGVFGPSGVLTVGVNQPWVTGANTRRWTSSEMTWVRYRVDVTAASNYATVLESGWSGWFAVRQRQSRYLPPSAFQMDWRGYYGADVLIEWWTRYRRVGYRWHRLESFRYIDNYNRGQWGPFPNCNRWNFPFN